MVLQTVNYSLEDESAVVADALVEVFTDSACTTFNTSDRTDAFGIITFHLQAGTYYLWRTKAGKVFTNPLTVVVDGTETVADTCTTGSAAADDAYIDVADAETWLTAHVTYITPWTNATNAQKAASLIEASDHIDGLSLKGSKYADNQTQERAFPRIPDRAAQVVPYDSEINFQSEEDYSEVPQEVLDACCYEALAILDIMLTADRRERLSLQREGVEHANYSGTLELYAKGSGSRYRGLLSKNAMIKLADWVGALAEAV